MAVVHIEALAGDICLSEDHIFGDNDDQDCWVNLGSPVVSQFNSRAPSPAAGSPTLSPRSRQQQAPPAAPKPSSSPPPPPQSHPIIPQTPSSSASSWTLGNPPGWPHPFPYNPADPPPLGPTKAFIAAYQQQYIREEIRRRKADPYNRSKWAVWGREEMEQDLIIDYIPPSQGGGGLQDQIQRIA
eukprot:gene6891-7107_t